MSADNCAILGCNIFGRTKGIAIFRVRATGNNEWSNNWWKNITTVVTQDRVVGKTLKDRIGKKNIYVYEKQFPEKQLLKM